MTWGMVAVAGATVVGGAIAADSARSASNNIKDSAAASDATQKQMYDQTRQDNMPALDARNASLSRMRELLGIGGNTGSSGYGSLGKTLTAKDVMSEPGYQFGLKQGQDALNAQLAARGMRNSGAALQAASRYGTDYATTKFDNAFNRQQTQDNNMLNRFGTLAGAGQVGTSQIGQAGTNMANNVSNTQQGLGNALAASSIAQGNAWADAGNQLAGWYASYNRPKG